MDTGEGRFERFEDWTEELKKLKEKHPNHGSIFGVGEIVKLRDSFFRIESIKPTELRLKLLPKNYQEKLENKEN